MQINVDALKARLWMWIPFATFGVLALGLGYFAFLFLTDPTGEAGETDSHESLDELTIEENLRRAYLAANGGADSLAALQSIRLSGILETGGARVPFTSIKKRPWQSLLTLRFPSYELSLVVDNEVVWQRVTVPNKDPVRSRVEDAEATEIRQLGSFFDPVALVLLFNDGVIHGLTRGSWEGQPALVLNFENEKLQLTSKAYIDPRTLRLLARVDALENGSERTILYSDHRPVGGLLQPFVTETYVDDELQNRVTIERSEHNMGTFPSIFQYPVDQQ